MHNSANAYLNMISLQMFKCHSVIINFKIMCPLPQPPVDLHHQVSRGQDLRLERGGGGWTSASVNWSGTRGTQMQWAVKSFTKNLLQCCGIRIDFFRIRILKLFFGFGFQFGFGFRFGFYRSGKRIRFAWWCTNNIEVLNCILRNDLICASVYNNYNICLHLSITSYHWIRIPTWIRIRIHQKVSDSFGVRVGNSVSQW
jgi:hypothetical protein